MRIAIVAGETSGDQLGAGLMTEIQARLPDVHFEGIAGPLMAKAGCQTIFPMEKLAVMGLIEVLSHLPFLPLLIQHLTQEQAPIYPSDMKMHDSGSRNGPEGKALFRRNSKLSFEEKERSHRVHLGGQERVSSCHLGMYLEESSITILTKTEKGLWQLNKHITPSET